MSEAITPYSDDEIALIQSDTDNYFKRDADRMGGSAHSCHARDRKFLATILALKARLASAENVFRLEAKVPCDEPGCDEPGRTLCTPCLARAHFAAYGGE